MHFNYGLSCDLILVSKEAMRLIIHTRANEGGLETLLTIREVIKNRLTLQINVNNSCYSSPPFVYNDFEYWIVISILFCIDSHRIY
jgi:hypothetical protein